MLFDNLSSHKSQYVRRAVCAPGAGHMSCESRAGGGYLDEQALVAIATRLPESHPSVDHQFRSASYLGTNVAFRSVASWNSGYAAV